MRTLFRKICHQFCHRGSKLSGKRLWSPKDSSQTFNFGEKLPDLAARRCGERCQEIWVESIPVSLEKSVDIVMYVACIMGNTKVSMLQGLVFGGLFLGVVVLMLCREPRVAFFQEGIISRVTGKIALLIEDANNTVWFCLNQVTYRLPVRNIRKIPTLLLKNSTLCHSMPSRAYSSCSCFRTSSMNICWSFSLQ